MVDNPLQLSPEEVEEEFDSVDEYIECVSEENMGEFIREYHPEDEEEKLAEHKEFIRDALIDEKFSDEFLEGT